MSCRPGESGSVPEPEADQLVRQLRHAESPTARDQAVTALQAIIQRWAGQTVRGQGATAARDFAQEAVQELFEKGRFDRYDPAGGRFEPWCRTVLANLWRDRRRKLRRQHRHFNRYADQSTTRDPATGTLVHADAGTEGPPDPDAARDALRQRFAELRQALDHVAWQPKRDVDHYAVLLLHLRLVLLREATRAGIEPSETGMPRLGRWIETVLPWRPGEGSRQVSAGLHATIADIWADLAARVEQGEGAVDALLLIKVIRERTDTDQPTPSRWYQWKQRVAKHIREQHPELYERVFKHWLEAVQ